VLAELKSKAQSLRQDHALRGLLSECRRLLSERGEANGPAIAHSIVERLDALADDRRARFFDHLARDFGPTRRPCGQRASVCAATGRRATGAADTRHRAAAAKAVSAPEPRARRHRGNRAPAPRLARALAEDPQLQAVEADLLHLPSSWFNAGFLQMRRVDWNSPAQLLEQNHPPRGGARDRRLGRSAPSPAARPPLLCLLPPAAARRAVDLRRGGVGRQMAGAIAPLIDKKSHPLASDHFKVAVFYSISNCQPGLRNVSLGNFLIKRVADELSANCRNSRPSARCRRFQRWYRGSRACSASMRCPVSSRSRPNAQCNR
jgi:malonyl-CoA decarboxylase